MTTTTRAIEDSPYAKMLSGADPADLTGALRNVIVGDLARHPGRVAGALSDLSLRQTRVALRTLRRLLGEPAGEPLAPGDRRFADRAWQENPLLRGLAESYLATAAGAAALVDSSTVPPHVRRKARFAMGMSMDAVAPSNLPWVNPAVLKEALDTGGLSVITGLSTFLDDLLHNGGRPRQVDTSPFEIGRNMAATPGRVVFRNELIELLAYEPQTELVHAQPILCSPPWINKYYIMDLAPGRSFVEYAVQHGFTVFMISYRNPDESMATTTWDDYLRLGVLTALDQVQALTGSDVVNVVGLCLGGTMSAVALAYLAAHGESDRVGWLTLTNTLVDFSVPGDLGIFTDAGTVAKMEETMHKRGLLEGSSLAQTFDWLRGSDLVWNYVINNWYMGRKPPAFDLLAWNGDSTNMPAVMHSQYLRACYLENLLVQPGAFTIEGTAIDVRRITQPLYVLGAEADHIAPWRGGYLTTQHVGGEARYTLTSSGHIAGIVNPPGAGKASFRTGLTRHGLTADAWRAGIESQSGSWWEHWIPWAAERSGAMVAPPRLPEGEAAPGGYVRGLVAPAFNSGPGRPARAGRRRQASPARRASAAATTSSNGASNGLAPAAARRTRPSK